MALGPVAWITGAGGLIGNYLVASAPQFASQRDVVPLARPKLDLLDFAAVRQRFTAEQPQLIIHCAAMSKSPECQAKPELARRINVETTKLLAELATDRSFVFFSTDLVFDGEAGSYRESAMVNPLSVYGETKVEAERTVLANPKHLVIRTSLNAGKSPTDDKAFNEQMRLAAQRGERWRLFTDEFRSPIPAMITARATWELVNAKQTGIFHLAGSERLSRVEIGKLLATCWPELHPKIDEVSCRDIKNPPRPPDTSLDCSKAQKILSFQLPAFSNWLRMNPAALV